MLMLMQKFSILRGNLELQFQISSDKKMNLIIDQEAIERKEKGQQMHVKIRKRA